MKTLAICLWLAPAVLLAQSAQPFVVHVTDDLTGRGVPLVELRTLNEVLFVTDSVLNQMHRHAGLSAKLITLVNRTLTKPEARA